MLVVETIAKIRRAHLVQGKAIKAISRELKVSRKVVRKVISPLLANVYLHYVFDLWAQRWRRREATGDMIVVRYADDIIVGSEHETDAHRFRDAMRTRLQEFALSLHPDKTRLFEFGRHAAAGRAQRGLGKPETFNFLGFTFICGKTRSGKFQLRRKSRRDRMKAKLRMIKEELR
ncbi:MAG: reverse transcriptase domain-containing protein, partial [Rhodomicrobiaceae bacterium]